MTSQATHTVCPECGVCFTSDAHDILIKRLVADNDRMRDALMDIATAAGRENYPEELWAAMLMDKARGALRGKE